MSQRGRGSHDFGEIVLSTRAEAEETLAQMDDIIGRFGTTSIADLYEMLAIDEVYHTDEKWGWDNLRGSDVQRLRNGGYILVLPKPIPIG